MFCPNCGNACGDGRFCSKCGAKVPWEKLESALQAEQNVAGYPMPPVGEWRYNDRNGYVALRQKCLEIGKYISNQFSRVEVPYEDIHSVWFCSDFFWGGVLAVRTWENRDVPFGETPTGRANDAYCGIFSKKHEKEIRHVYDFLNAYVQINHAEREKRAVRNFLCPACGFDCGEGRFCARCGWKLTQEKVLSVWRVGMPCPHCGGVELDGNKCAFCGALLLAPETRKVRPQYPEPPVGKWWFGWRNGYLELTDKYIRICKSIPERHTDHIIPFDEIYSVMFNPGKWYYQGDLCVRTWQNRYTPFPETTHEQVHDELCAYVPSEANKEIHQVFLFLSRCAEINRTVRENQ